MNYYLSSWVVCVRARAHYVCARAHYVCAVLVFRMVACLLLFASVVVLFLKGVSIPSQLFYSAFANVQSTATLWDGPKYSLGLQGLIALMLLKRRVGPLRKKTTTITRTRATIPTLHVSSSKASKETYTRYQLTYRSIHTYIYLFIYWSRFNITLVYSHEEGKRDRQTDRVRVSERARGREST